MKPTSGKVIARFAGAVLLAAAAVWPARADYSSTLLSLTPPPIAYWQFNETAVSPAAFKLANSGSVGSVGDAYASISVINGVPGVSGNAAEFSNLTGTAHAGSRADVVYVPALNPNAFTIEFWAQPSSQTLSGSFDATGSCPLSNFNPNNYPNGRVGYLFYLANTGVWNFRMGLPSGYAVNIITSGGAASAGVWQHIVATYDGTTANVYANGVLIGTKVSLASSTGWVPNTGSFLRFGATPLVGDTAALTADALYYLPWDQATPVSGNRGWDGLLDEVAIYTNALSPATIAAHYAAAATPATYGATILADQPVGYWNFNEPAVTAPDPSTFPFAANSGSLGSVADGTNVWGAVAAQPGPAYPGGFPVGNKAVTFDGLNGSFTVKNAAGLHFTTNITLAAWVKPTADNYKLDIIEHGFDRVGAETFLRISRGSGQGYGTGNYYEVGTTEGEANDGFYDSALFPIPPGDIGNWVYLVGTFDGANWNLYRNGVLVAQAAPYVGASIDIGAIDVTNNWTIGSRGGPSEADGNRFSGSIDEPAIFTNALSPSDIATLYSSAQVPPIITRAPQNPGTVFKGSTVSLSVFADGAPTLGYLWTSNSISTGVTATNFTISNIPVGTYTIAVTVTNDYGTNSASVTFSAVAAPPSITTQPSPATRLVGYPFTLSVVAGGSSPLTYIWNLGTTVVQAGASPTYSAIASLANAGTYTVIVSNETTINVTSAPVVLTVNPVPAGYPASVVASGPVDYWRLDEASGTRAFDTVGGNDGTYNSATLGVPGYSVLDPDTAASFSGPNSYVGSISGTAINFTGHTNFTLEAWVKGSPGQSDEATIIAKGTGANGTVRSEQFSLDVASGAYRFFTTGGNTLYEADARTGPNGSWQHIVGVYDDNNILGGGSNLYIYVNGVLEGQAAVRPAGLNNTTSAVSIGSKRTGNDPNYDGTFEGTVDEVAVYNYPLNASTIQAHYAAAYGTTLAPFIAVQPAPTTNYIGLPATISVAAAGSVTLTYQWKRNNVNVTDDGVRVGGATTDNLTITNLSSTDGGNYSVAITNAVSPGVVSVSVPLVVLPVPSTPPAIAGLVVHLPLTNTLTDVTGRGNNGTNVNGATFVLDGPLGLPALRYSTDSTNPVDIHYVTLGVRPDLSFSSNVSFSAAFWIRLPLNYQGGDLPFFTDVTNSTFGKGFVFAPTYGTFATASPGTATAVDGGWAFSVFDGLNAGIGGHGPANSINDGGWHHLVYVENRQVGSVTYLDGVPSRFTKQQGTTVKAAGNIDNGAPANIGQGAGGAYGEIGSGDIADLGVWRKALTPLEAASIYIAGASNLLSYVTGPITFTSQMTNSTRLQLTWNAGTLQSASIIQGPWADVTPVSPYTLSTTNAVKFFRVKL